MSSSGDFSWISLLIAHGFLLPLGVRFNISTGIPPSIASEISVVISSGIPAKILLEILPANSTDIQARISQTIFAGVSVGVATDIPQKF